jgi:bifunctional non-homologous end joining protein LigD
MKGKKMKGEWALVKTHGRGENAWLLFKVNDKYADSSDITAKEKSVLSGKTLAQVEKSSTNFYGKPASQNAALRKKKDEEIKAGKSTVDRAPKKAAEKEMKKTAKKEVKKAVKKAAKKTTQAAKKKSPAAKKPAKKSALNTAAKKKAPEGNDPVTPLLKAAPSSRFSSKFRPMLATLVDSVFEEEGWIYEVKWDGYRALALSNKGIVELKSRNDKSFNDKFYPVTAAVADLGYDVILDGEIVVVGENGISDFGALQNWRSEADGELLFYAFDVLWYDGKDLTSLPLIDRKQILKHIIPEEGIIKISDSFSGSASEFFEAAKQMGLEGIIAKRADSLYSVGNRSKEWLKIKANKRQEMVIGGYTRNDDTSKLFSALLVGVFEKGKLVYTGKVGTGFSDKLQKEMLAQFKPLIIDEPPFTAIPDVNKPSRFRPNPPRATAVWLKPELVCEVSFTEMTSDGIMRHPSFQGMRIDKKAKDVVREVAGSAKKIVADSASPMSKMISGKAAKSKPERKTLVNPTEETQVKKVNGHELKLTNLSKIYWPKEGYTKRDLINYYYQMAPYILPYLKDRPQSMLRHPDGIKGFSFFYKNIKGKGPDWLETYNYHSETDGEDKEYLVAKDDASLLYMASLGAIEMNPWHSKVQSEDYPDWCIIDLDPAKNTFDQVIEAANVTREILESMGCSCYAKTSGSTGIHVYIPLGAKYTYDESKEFARIIATLVHRELPAYTSIERAVKNRKGKMYIDFLQNRPQATVSAPYSVRPKPGATVSMPLHWEEVKKGLKMTDFTIENAYARVREIGDIFKPVLGKGIDMAKAIKLYERNEE